jgi:hypothetical protein
MESQSWRRLEGQAHWIMAHAEQSPPTEPLRGMGLQLRLWHHSGSGAHVSWSLIVPVRDYRGRKVVIREVGWDRSFDRRRKVLLDPSIHIRDAEVDWSELAPFLDTAGRLAMNGHGTDPSLPSEKDVSGLEGFRSLAHIRLEWAGKGPRGWGTTVAWFGKFRRMLARIVKARDTEARKG